MQSFEAKKLTEAHLIAKFGVYRHPDGGVLTPTEPAEAPAGKRLNAYLALVAYLERQSKIIKG